jgi:hypothetical protein
LADVPKPWFFSKPNDDGEWTGNKLDDDVWFWSQWKAAGRTVYMDPSCIIGHMEEMVTTFNPDNMRAIHLYPADWQTAMNHQKRTQNVVQANEKLSSVADGICVL